jgi:hypothetical protein
MVLGDILNQAWKLLGEPSDLNPADATGREYLIQGLNQGQNAIAAWKDPIRGIFFYYNQFRKHGFIQYAVNTGTLSGGSTTSVVILSSSPELDLVGSVLVINGEERVIILNTGGTCTVDEPFTTVTAGDAYALHRKWINIPATVRFLEVLKVEDFGDKQELRRMHDSDVGLAQDGQTGTPTEWFRVGQRIYFNQAPDEGKVYRFWYFSLPTPFTNADTAESQLPESVHFGLVMWLVYWGYQWMQEPNDAYAAQERFKNYMRSIQNESDVKDYMNQSYRLTVKM